MGEDAIRLEIIRVRRLRARKAPVPSAPAVVGLHAWRTEGPHGCVAGPRYHVIARGKC